MTTSRILLREFLVNSTLLTLVFYYDSLEGVVRHLLASVAWGDESVIFFEMNTLVSVHISAEHGGKLMLKGREFGESKLNLTSFWMPLKAVSTWQKKNRQTQQISITNDHLITQGTYI